MKQSPQRFSLRAFSSFRREVACLGMACLGMAENKSTFGAVEKARKENVRVLAQKIFPKRHLTRANDVANMASTTTSLSLIIVSRVFTAATEPFFL